MPNGQYNQKFWHVDRGIPLAMFAGLFIQTAAIIWWAAHLDSRVANLEQGKIARDAQLSSIDAKIVAGDLTRNDLNVRLIHVEDKTSAVLDAVDKMNLKVDRLVEAIQIVKKPF